MNKFKFILILTIIILLGYSIYSQNDSIKESPWKFSGITALNISQINFTNWAAGGDNSINSNSFIKLSANQ